MHKLDKLCQLGNIINFEYSENFPNSGFTLLIFPIGKALGPLPKIAKKIPVMYKNLLPNFDMKNRTTMSVVHVFKENGIGRLLFA